MNDVKTGDTDPGGHVFSLSTARIGKRILWTCLTLEILWVVLDATLNYARWLDAGSLRRLFNITREDGLASWFGVTQTSFCALTLWLIWWTEKGLGAGRRHCAGWLLLALFFTYMAVDDGGMIHERLGSAFKGAQYDALQEGQTGWLAEIYRTFPSYSWQFLFAPMFISLGFFIGIFTWRQMKTPPLRKMLIVALSLLALALALDFMEGLPLMHPLNPYRALARIPELDESTRALFHTGAYPALKHFSKSLEEFLEMAAMTLMWSAFVVQAGVRSPLIRLHNDASA